MKEEQLIHSPDSSCGLGVRHVQMLLQFLFYIIIFGIVASLSVVLPVLLHSTNNLDDTPLSVISHMVFAYTLGFFITEIFSGFVCKKYGFKWPMVILMSVISAVTLNLPVLTSSYGAQGITIGRIIQGICIGLLFSMPAEAISRWVPVKERTLLGTIIYSSGLLGEDIISYLVSYLGNSKNDWSFINIQLGFTAIVWVVLMAIFGADSPEQYGKKISERELDYIVNNRGNVVVKKKMKIPWSKILTSMPFWAIVIAQIGAGWALTVLVVNIPMLMIYGFKMERNNNIVPLITLITWLMSFVIAAVAQSLINNGKTTIEQSRKLFNTLGSCIPAFFFLLFLFISEGNQYVGIAIWVTMSVSTIGTICGSKLNSNDITTNFAPVVYGTASWVSLLFNIVNQILVGYPSFDNWNFLMIYSAVVVLLSNLFYIKFGSGEEQDWNLYEDIDDEHIDLSNSNSRTSVDEGKYLLYVKKQ